MYSSRALNREFLTRRILLAEPWFKLIFDMIESVGLTFSPDKRVLEVGCGTGGLCSWTSKRSENVTGLDIAKSAVTIANAFSKKLKRRARFIVGDASSLPLRDGYYDIVICAETLEHITNYRKAFDELIRVTAESGYIIITVPNYVNERFYLPFQPQSYLAGGGWSQPADENLFDIFSFDRLFDRKDLKVITRRGVGLINLISPRPKIKCVERRLYKSFNKLRFLCMNMGVIAQKTR